MIFRKINIFSGFLAKLSYIKNNVWVQTSNQTIFRKMTKTSPNTNWPTYHKMILETDYILFFRDEFLDAQLFGLLPEEVFQFVCYLVILAFLVIVDSAVRENLQHVRHELAWNYCFIENIVFKLIKLT